MIDTMRSVSAALARNIRIPSAPRLWLPGSITPVRKSIHVLHAWSWQTDPEGKTIWAEPAWVSNILHDEGEQYILACAFDTDTDTAPANLYFGLDARVTPAEADTLVSLSGEPSGSGYARQPVSTSTGFTLSQDAGDYQAASSTVTFTASGGDWTAVLNRFLGDVVSGTAGRLIATLALDASRTITDGSSLNTNYTVKLSE